MTVAVVVVSMVIAGVIWAAHGPDSSRRVATIAKPAASAAALQSVTAVAPSNPAPTTVAPTTIAPTTVAPSTVVQAPAHSNGAPTKSSAPPPAAKPATSTAGTDFGPRPPGSVNLPFQAGQHVWSAVSNGITLTLDMEPASPHAGEVITFTMTATAAASLPCCALYLVPSSTSMAWQPIPSTGDACIGHTLPTSAQHVLTQTYNKACRLDFLFGAHNLCVTSTLDVTAAIYGSFDLGAGPSTSQGPLPPVLHLDDGRLPNQLHDPNLAVAYAQATDADGHIAGFTLDWGDGTPVETFPGDPSPCVDSSQGWPGSSTTLLTTGGVYAAPQHRYATPRPTSISVTVVSTGCDGADPQRVTGTFPWVPPAPQP